MKKHRKNWEKILHQFALEERSQHYRSGTTKSEKKFRQNLVMSYIKKKHRMLCSQKYKLTLVTKCTKKVADEDRCITNYF
jgi:hypothetical protein